MTDPLQRLRELHAEAARTLDLDALVEGNVRDAIHARERFAEAALETLPAIFDLVDAARAMYVLLDGDYTDDVTANPNYVARFQRLDVALAALENKP